MSSPGFSDETLLADYDLLEQQAHALLDGERNFVANAANFAAFVYHALPAINWAGFYLADESGLVLGPFAGRPASSHLAPGRGVCGAAFSAGKTIVVDDVNAFPDHIACDSDSRSEIVVPLSDGNTIAGVFDVDSPQLARFTVADKAGLERLTNVFIKTTPLPPLPTAPPASKRLVLNERIDIQTCRDHHVVLRYLVEEIGKPDVRPDASLGLLKRLRTVLLAHLKLEDDWLYPHLQRSVNDVVRHKSQTYAREMGGLKENFATLWHTWTRPNAIANSEAWQSDWHIFQKALLERMDREDHDLYVAAEASLATPNG